MLIKFNDSDKLYNLLYEDNGRLVTLSSYIDKVPENTSGFCLIDDYDNKTVLVSHNDFSHIYRKYDSSIIYANKLFTYYIYFVYNNDLYVIDKIISTKVKEDDSNLVLFKIVPELEYIEQNNNDFCLLDDNGLYNYKVCSINNSLEVVQVTEDEKVELLFQKKVKNEEQLKIYFEKSKENKINESKALLAKYLETHPLVSNCHGGVEAEYNVTSEKQALMSSNYLTYTIAKTSGLDAKLTWNASGCECEEWTEEEYVTLVLQISEYVKPLVSLQQSYEVAINNCTSQEELDAIEIVYDVYGVAENE